MEILGIGPLELFFIVIIALIILGPKDMVKAGKTIGSFLRKLVTSSSWRTIQQTSRELKHLPNKLMSEAGLDEIEKDLGLKEIEKNLGLKEIKRELNDIQKDTHIDISDWTTPPVTSLNEISDDKSASDISPASESISDTNPAVQSTPNT